MEKSGFYSTTNINNKNTQLEWKNVKNTLVCATGSFDEESQNEVLNPRFLRYFTLFALPVIEDEALHPIYSIILKEFLAKNNFL